MSTLASLKQDSPRSFKSETILRGSTAAVYAYTGRLQHTLGTRLADVPELAQTRSMQAKNPRGVIEWLLRDREDLRHEDGPHAGEPNFYKLERLIKKKIGRTVSQSTFQRLWTGSVKEISGKTVDVLHEYFDVPESVIRGELTLPQLDSLGMDITLTEVQFIERLRNLTPEVRKAIETQVRALQPPQTPNGGSPTPSQPNGTSSLSKGHGPKNGR